MLRGLLIASMLTKICFNILLHHLKRNDQNVTRNFAHDNFDTGVFYAIDKVD